MSLDSYQIIIKFYIILRDNYFKLYFIDKNHMTFYAAFNN